MPPLLALIYKRFSSFYRLPMEFVKDFLTSFWLHILFYGKKVERRKAPEVEVKNSLETSSNGYIENKVGGKRKALESKK